MIPAPCVPRSSSSSSSSPRARAAERRPPLAARRRDPAPRSVRRRRPSSWRSPPAPRSGPARGRTGRSCFRTAGVSPARTQIAAASDLPVRMVWHPGGRWLAIQHAGNREHGVAIFDARAEEVVAAIRAPVAVERHGLQRGRRATLRERRRPRRRGRVSLRPVRPGRRRARLRGPPPWRRRSTSPRASARSRGGLLVALQRSQHRIAASTRTGRFQLDAPLPQDSSPFECLAATGDVFAVSLWGAGDRLALLDADDAGERRAARDGAAPEEIVLLPRRQRLFVSNANENTVSVIDAGDGARRGDARLGAVSRTRRPGSTPDSLASLAGRRDCSLVANADNNDCAVIDVEARGRSRGLGFVPVGMYPTSVRFSPDGTTVFVANGKGSGWARTPTRAARAQRADHEEPGRLHGVDVHGLAVGLPVARRRPRSASLTARAYGCSPLAPRGRVRSDAPRPAGLADPGAPRRARRRSATAST